MAMIDGIQPLIDFATPATSDTKVDALLAAIPDPDSTSTSGAIQGIIGFLDQMSPMCAAQLRVELGSLKDNLGGTGDVASGQHTVTAGEATANQVDIVTGLSDLTLANCAVSVRRAGTLTGSPVITEPSAGTLRVADNSTTYDVTAGDVITWMAKS